MNNFYVGTHVGVVWIIMYGPQQAYQPLLYIPVAPEPIEILKLCDSWGILVAVTEHKIAIINVVEHQIMMIVDKEEGSKIDNIVISSS